MPNYPIGDTPRRWLMMEVNRLMQLRKTCMEQNFPLTATEVINAAVPKPMRDALTILKNAGCTSINQNSTLYAYLPGGNRPDGDPAHAFIRPSIIEMKLPVRTYYMFENQVSQYGAQNLWSQNGDMSRLLPFDMLTLSKEQERKLVLWVNAAVRETRIGRGVKKLCEEFLAQHAPTMAHIDQRWPGFKPVFQGLDEPWKSRARFLPTTRIKTAWKWPSWGPVADWRKDNAEKMRYAEHFILAATVMDRPVQKPSGGSIVHGSVIKC